MQAAIKAGVKSYLLKTCDKLEIYEALYATAKGEKFYCSKVLDVIINEPDLGSDKSLSANCDGVSISERESEIIVLIAEGFSNKEIADKLFLSPHTVNTHRKNIMAKIGVNNTAGIVIYAVKEQLISPNKFLFSAVN
jgi:DNA-binding NarL/FixJ family response regulator